VWLFMKGLGGGGEGGSPIDATQPKSSDPSKEAANPLPAPGKLSPGGSEPSATPVRIRMAVAISESLCLEKRWQSMSHDSL